MNKGQLLMKTSILKKYFFDNPEVSNSNRKFRKATIGSNEK